MLVGLSDHTLGHRRADRGGGARRLRDREARHAEPRRRRRGLGVLAGAGRAGRRWWSRASGPGRRWAPRASARPAAEREGLRFRRSLYVVADVRAGDAVSRDNVRSIRPAGGLAPGRDRHGAGPHLPPGRAQGHPADLGPDLGFAARPAPLVPVQRDRDHGDRPAIGLALGRLALHEPEAAVHLPYDGVVRQHLAARGRPGPARRTRTRWPRASPSIHAVNVSPRDSKPSASRKNPHGPDFGSPASDRSKKLTTPVGAPSARTPGRGGSGPCSPWPTSRRAPRGDLVLVDAHLRGSPAGCATGGSRRRRLRWRGAAWAFALCEGYPATLDGVPGDLRLGTRRARWWAVRTR